MRMKALGAILVALFLAPALAAAQSTPSGARMFHGAWADPSGKPLYTYDNDTMKGMSHCEADCAQA